jgi:hypothetical protein
MKTIKGLTDDQNKIISNVVNEFILLNSNTNKEFNNEIEKLFKQANKLANRETNFYKNIEVKNNLIKQQGYELRDTFAKKLKMLFENYPSIQIKIDDTSIKIGETNNCGHFLKGYFYFNVATYIKRNPFDNSIRFSYQNDKSKKGVSVYVSTSILLEKEVIDIYNIENNSLFKSNVLEMFRQSSLRKNNL